MNTPTPRATVTATRRAPENADSAQTIKDTHEDKIQRSAAAQITNGFALLCICIIAFSTRLFSVIKYESVIHEFDPYFNYRVTQFLTKEGFYNLWNWFDTFTWYPLGRVVGGTVYPVSPCILTVLRGLLQFTVFSQVETASMSRGNPL